MTLTEQQLDSFIALYIQKTGRDIPRDEALDVALRMMKAVELIESNIYKKV